MNRWVAGVLIALFLLLGCFSIILGKQIKSLTIPQPFVTPTVSQVASPSKEPTAEEPSMSVFAQDLEIPWSMSFLPDGRMLVTERPGRVRLITAEGTLQPEPVATLAQVKQIGEGGLLGITIHPQFIKNHFVYLYYTYSNKSTVLNRVSRFVFDGNKLNDEKVIFDNIPAAANHNGGRIKFGPDGYLYLTAGDSQDQKFAQTTSSLAGKILRVTDEGKAAPGNPFDNAVYSYGHRNPQGLAWDDMGHLWATEHGRSGALSGFDEVNRIEQGKNYGWPTIEGDETQDGMVAPVINSGATTTWAPSGLAYYEGSLFFGGLRGQGLYEAVIENNRVTSLKKHFDGELGRIRDVIVGPDNFLYITTSNRDGRGIPKDHDDKILRVNPAKL